MQDILHLIRHTPEPERSMIIVEYLKNLDREALEAHHTRQTMIDGNMRIIMNLERGCEQLKELIAEKEVTISNLKKQMEDLENHKYAGCTFIEIPNYLQKKTEAIAGTPSFYSDDFYTEYYGYRMCVCVCLSGDGTGKGSHLSVYLVLKKGDHDNILSWPFKRHVTFTLRNQDSKDHKSNTLIPDPSHPSFQKPVEQMNVASGFPMFVAHSVIENPEEGFLRNDTIAIEVVVNQHDHS